MAPDDSAAWQQWIRNHLGLFISVLVSSVVFFRVVAVADFNVATSLALLSTNGTANVLVGAVLSSAVSVLLVVAQLALVVVIPNLRSRDLWNIPPSRPREAAELWANLFGLSAVILIAIAALPVYSLLLLLFVVLVSFLIPLGKPTLLRTGMMFAILPIGLVSLVVFNRGMWMPAEVVSVQDGRELVGYVLEDAGQWTTILGENERSIRYLQSDRITKRTVCIGKGQEVRSLIEVLRRKGAAPHPPCPEEDHTALAISPESGLVIHLNGARGS